MDEFIGYIILGIIGFLIGGAIGYGIQDAFSPGCWIGLAICWGVPICGCEFD